MALSILLPSTESVPATEVQDKEVMKQSQPESSSKRNDETEIGETEDSTPKGMLGELKTLYQKKDSDNKYQWVADEPDDVEDAAENKETAKFAFLVRNKKSYDSRKKYEIDSIIVQSPLLKKALGVAFKEYPSVTTTLDRLVFRAPFAPFVHRWLNLTEVLNTTEDETEKVHLQLLYDVLYAELKDAIDAKNDLVKNGVITFEHLWTIFEPGTTIFAVDEGKERAYELMSTSEAMDQKRGLKLLRIAAWAADFDGTGFGKSPEYLECYQFEGTKPITSLRTFPLEFHPQRDELVERLTARGKLFEKFAGYHYQHYKGFAMGYGRCGLIRHSVDSRIIVDCDAHNRFLPERAVYFSPLGREDNGDYDNDNHSQDGEERPDDDSEYMWGEDDAYIHASRSNGSEDQLPRRPLTDHEILVSVPFVRGYAVKNKKWLIFFVDQIAPIKFSDDAFASLVLPAQQKSLIRAFVDSQVKYKDTFDDIISGKGRGMIFLLSGPPGVGKTLTAESVAEDLRAPLYMMSAGDLGLDPSAIEQTLSTILDMVAKWNAVLLLDEADVFLEARSSSDLERNKMVSIFLRMMEYYEGILFLTTNRIQNIDEAFHSRIHISMQYPALAASSRRHIWSTFAAKTSGLTGAQLDKLAQVELNGRQIKNVVKTAQMLARSSGAGDQVTMAHIETILSIESGKEWK